MPTTTYIIIDTDKTISRASFSGSGCPLSPPPTPKLAQELEGNWIPLAFDMLATDEEMIMGSMAADSLDGLYKVAQLV